MSCVRCQEFVKTGCKKWWSIRLCWWCCFTFLTSRFLLSQNLKKAWDASQLPRSESHTGGCYRAWFHPGPPSTTEVLRRRGNTGKPAGWNPKFNVLSLNLISGSLLRNILSHFLLKAWDRLVYLSIKERRSYIPAGAEEQILRRLLQYWPFSVMTHPPRLQLKSNKFVTTVVCLSRLLSMDFQR